MMGRVGICALLLFAPATALARVSDAALMAAQDRVVELVLSDGSSVTGVVISFDVVAIVVSTPKGVTRTVARGSVIDLRQPGAAGALGTSDSTTEGERPPEVSEPPALADVCFRRATGSSGWAVPILVRLDGADLEHFSVGEQKCFSVPAGSHTFGAMYWARVHRATTRPAATATLDLAGNDCHYYKVVFGFWGLLLEESSSMKFGPAATCGHDVPPPGP
jgi:hypothetical protein